MAAALPLLGAATAACAGMAGMYFALQAGLPSSSNLPAMGDIALLKPTLFPAFVSIALFYVFLFVQSASAFSTHQVLKDEAKARGDKAPVLGDVKYGGKAIPVLRMERTVGNFLEQSVPFYLGLFLHAVFVSPNAAAKAGWLWIAFRCYYPYVWMMKFPAVLTSTMPAYGCVAYLWWGVMTAATKL